MTKNNLPVIPEEIVTSKIYFIRKQKEMLDEDLAELYEVETKQLLVSDAQVNRKRIGFRRKNEEA